MSTLFKQTLIRLALRVIRGLTVVVRGFGAFFRFTFFKPGSLLGRGFFRLLLLPVYTWYVQLKRRWRLSPHTVGIRTFGQFLQRYALYMIIVSLGVFGLATNLFARTVRPDEVGQGSLWTAFLTGEATEFIVETKATHPTATITDAVGGPALISNNVSAPETSTTASTTVAELGAVAALEQSGDSPRQTVESYVVKGGDTISTIASSFGVSSRTILWANGLGENDYIKPGQSLKIPSTTGYLYTVKSGDTIASVAKKYKGNEDQILAANSLPLAEALQPGQDIIIPGGEPPAPPAPPPSRSGIFGQIFVRGENPPPGTAATGARFIWPTPGHRVNQYFRGRWHTGIDIDGEYSSPVYAAATGTVSFASSDRSGYGLHVILSHGNGLTTLYGHASKVFVRAGQSVRQGQTIAMQGCTGRCSGVHLHFEIRRGGVPTNPLSYY